MVSLSLLAAFYLSVLALAAVAAALSAAASAAFNLTKFLSKTACLAAASALAELTTARAANKFLSA